MTHPLQGKTALITGASRGIGAQTARVLAQHGAQVIINYSQSEAKALALVQEIQHAGGKALALQADLSDPAQITRLFAQAKQAVGTIDILVNNARMLAQGGMHEITQVQIDQQLALNVRAPALAAQEFVNAHQGGDARIINISTFITGNQAMGGAVMYCATKGAINTLTAGWAQELGAKGIRVNAVAPGAIETDMYESSGKNFEDYLKSRTPLGTIGQPTAIADMITYLCSPQAAWITGQVFTVSGGIRI